jgi:acetyltransferase-like isoleucine patch superfamily enzyme
LSRLLGPVTRPFRARDNEIRVAWRTLRHKLLLVRVKAIALRERSSVTIELAPDVRIGRGLRVVVLPRTSSSMRLGAGSTIGDNVTLYFRGGALVGGVRTDLRTNVALHIGGHILLDGENVLGYGCVIHCGDSVHMGYATIAGEYCGIADSRHFHTTADEPIQHNTLYAPVEIGRNSLLAPRVSVGRGVTIGPWCVVGPGSVVAKDLPAGVFASGIPAVVVRDLEHPWMTDAASTETAGR